MNKSIFLVCVLCFWQSVSLAQSLEIRPQFGHDPLWGDVSEDGHYAVTGSRYSIVLWDLHNGDALLERPFRCNDVQFLRGFPCYCVAADLFRDDLSLDSMDNCKSVINLITGEVLFQIDIDIIKRDKQSLFQFSIPFDANGRCNVVDNHGDLLTKFGGRLAGGIANVEISPSGKYLLVAGKHPVVWDLDMMRISHEIPYYDIVMLDGDKVDAGLDIVPIPKRFFNYKRKAEILIGWRQFLKAHFVKNDEIIAGAPGGNIFLFSSNGELIRTYTTNETAKCIYDCTEAGSIILATTGDRWVFSGSRGVDTLCVSKPSIEDIKKAFRITYEVLPIPDHDIYLTTTDNWRLYQGSFSHPEQELKIIPLGPFPDLASSLSMGRIDKSQIIVTGTCARYCFYNLETGTAETHHWKDNFVDLQACIVLADGRILIGADQGRIGVIEKGAKEVTKEIACGSGQIRGIAEDVHRSRIYVSSSDGAVKILDRESLSLIATCYNLGEKNSIIITPDGYYASDKGVANLIMYGRGLDMFSFDRFDLVKNRPDIIKERLGRTKEEVALLYKVYQKRLRRMGFTQEQLAESSNLPETAITRFPSAKEVKVDRITMRAQFRDNTYPIVKVMAWLNGTPIFGRDGISVNGNEIERDFEVKLASGENNIEISCINSAGVESLRETRTIVYDNPHPQRDLYVVSLGVSDYRQEGFNLRYAAKDARDMANLFEESGRGRYDHINTLCLTNQDVRADAPSIIRNFISDAGRDDVVIAFYAGHGLVSRDYDYYLSTNATDFSSPETTAIRFDDFESVFDGVPSLDKLVLIDACHSGEIDKEDVQSVVYSAMTKGAVHFRGSSLGKESVESQILNEQFNDLRRGLGATVLAGSSGMEVAVEGEQWQNGLFTWVIRKGIMEMAADRDEDGKVTVSEIMQYGEKEVYRLSDGKQSPKARNINPVCDFVIRERGR